MEETGQFNGPLVVVTEWSAAEGSVGEKSDERIELGIEL